MKYLDLIKTAKEAVEAIKAPFIAKKNELKLEQEINELESKIAEADLEIQNQKMSKEVSWSKVREALDDKALLERQLKQMQDLKKELF